MFGTGKGGSRRPTGDQLSALGAVLRTAPSSPWRARAACGGSTALDMTIFRMQVRYGGHPFIEGVVVLPAGHGMHSAPYILPVRRMKHRINVSSAWFRLSRYSVQ